MPTQIIVEASHASDLQPDPDTHAMLFGWDGTLFDDRDFNFHVLSDALSAQGVLISQRWFNHHANFSTREIIGRACRKAHRAADPNSVIAERNRLAADRLADMRPNLLLHKLIHEHGDRIAMGVVAGLERSSITTPLRAYNLHRAIRVIVTRDELLRAKPYADGYLLACRRLNTAPQHVQVFEDSAEGVTAAVRAGVGRIVDVRPLRDSVHDPLTEDEERMLTFATQWSPYGGGSAEDICLRTAASNPPSAARSSATASTARMCGCELLRLLRQVRILS